MAVKSKDEIMKAIKDRLGDDSSDEALGLIEDVSDTFDSLETQVSESGDWKTKYETNDKEWREKYKERFFSSGTNNDEDNNEQDYEDETKKPLNYEDLFKTE